MDEDTALLWLERWLPVVGYEGFYEVSDLGRARSLPRRTAKGLKGGRILKGSRAESGHIAVMLSKHGSIRRRMVHQLVAEAFIGPRPLGQETRHLNDVPDDNRLVNLVYGTRSENAADALRNGRNYFANRTHCPHGHPYDEVNTYWTRKGNRGCRACFNEKSKRRHQQQRLGIGKPCTTPGCNRAQIAKGLCGTCYVSAARASKRGPEWAERVCAACQKPFMASQQHRKYCSDECATEVRRIASRERIRSKKLAARAYSPSFSEAGLVTTTAAGGTGAPAGAAGAGCAASHRPSSGGTLSTPCHDPVGSMSYVPPGKASSIR